LVSKYEREYISKHELILNKLAQLTREGCGGCIPVARLASELGMDQRTVRAHLKILEVDRGGVFADADGKEFCTRDGIVLLARRLGLIGEDERSSNL